MASIVPLALRLGAAALAGFSAHRFLQRQRFPLRRDQKLEDGLDSLQEGLSYGSFGQTQAEPAQHHANFRLDRDIALGSQSWRLEVIGALRIKLRKN